MYKTILKDAEKYVAQLFAKNNSSNLLFHNLQHTTTVVARANEIAAHYDLNDEEIFTLNLAAIFHDTGHLFAMPNEHEAKSAEIAEEWLKEKTDSNTIEKVKQLIIVTKLTATPSNLLEKIIKDADTYSFGTKEFKKNDKLLKEEMRLRNFTTLLASWDENKIATLENHEFYTDYAKNLLDAKKQKNILAAKQKTIITNAENTGTSVLLNDNNANGKDASKQNSFIAKGIQTMLRLSSENHMKLSDMADQKANILISVNAIIISLILSVLLRKLETEPHLTIPSLLFLATAVTTIILSIIATRPKITKGNFSREDVSLGKTNLLFFGNFYKTSLEDYKWGMSMMMRDPNYLYSGLVDDIYYLGAVLGKKYKLISIAYYVFMIGLVVSVLAFLMAMWLHGQNPVTPIHNSSANPF